MPPLLGDGERLKQVIWNLIANAIKFTPRGGRIELALTVGDAVLQLAVRDTGLGIAPDFLPFVFERFRQAESSHERSGLGLGLAIARQLVELHGGTIQAESAGLGQGARLSSRFPQWYRRVRPASRSSNRPSRHLRLDDDLLAQVVTTRR